MIQFTDEEDPGLEMIDLNAYADATPTVEVNKDVVVSLAHDTNHHRRLESIQADVDKK